MTYDPRDWYWRADDGRIFSSARIATIAEDDATWLEREAAGSWTAWPVDDAGEQTDAALQWVFDNAGVHAFVGLSALKASRKAAIDAAAEAERLKYITQGAGQAMTYARKVEQACAVLATADPQPEDYPMLAASIGIDGVDLRGVAETIIAMNAAWEQVGAAIEGARLAAKRAVDLAASAEDVIAVSPAWPG